MTDDSHSIDPEDLLSQSNWVRGLARSLLFDQSQVDDTVQQTWLIALRGSAGRPQRLRAWLGGIVRNVVHRGRRDTTRRTRRERVVAAGPQTNESPADLVAQAEMHRRVVSAVLGLPEPYRSTILMRFFQDLGTEEIARRQSVPGSTVRSRIRRALEQLRRALDSEFGGDRGAWSLTLVPMAAASMAGKAATAHATSTTLKGALAMSIKTKVVVGVIAVGLLIGSASWMLRETGGSTSSAGSGLLISGTDDVGTSVEDLRVGRDTGDLPAPQPVAFGSEPTHDETADEGEAALGVPATFSGRILDRGGRPVAGAEVILLPSERTLNANGLRARITPELEQHLPRTRTQEDGRFRLDTHHVPLSRGELVDFFNWLFMYPEVAVVADGHGTAIRVCRGYTGGLHELGDITLPDAASVAGRVVDERGHPLVGIRVHFSNWIVQDADLAGSQRSQSNFGALLWSTVTNADGRFVLSRLPPGGGRLEVGQVGDLRTEIRDVSARPDLPADLGDIVLTAGGTIEGVVVDDDGRPVEGAQVLASDRILRQPERETWHGEEADDILDQIGAWRDRARRTGPDGSFRLVGLQGDQQTVWAWADGFEPTRVQPVATGTTDLALYLVPQALLHVLVVDEATKESVSGARLSAVRPKFTRAEGGIPLGVRPEETVSELAHTVTPAPASFVVERPGIHATHVTVQAAGYASRGFVLPGITAPQQATHTVALERESLVRGRITDVVGNAIADAVVMLSAPTTLRVALAPRTARTDASGEFELAGLAHGDWELVASAHGYLPSDPRLLIVSKGTVVSDTDIVLEQAGAVRGVLRESDGTPAAGQLLAMWPRGLDGKIDQDAGKQVLADTEGIFALDSLAPGPWRLQGGPGTSQEFVLEAGKTTELDVRMRRHPRLYGRVIDEVSGGPVSGVQVIVEGIGTITSKERRGERVTMTIGFTATDAEGRYDFAGMLSPWTAEVFAIAPGGVTSARRSVVLRWDQDELLDLSFGSSRISGVVTDALTRAPVAGVSVRVSDSASWRPMLSDDEGRFTLAHMSPGQHTLEWNGAGYMQVGDLTVSLGYRASAEDVILEVSKGASVKGVVRTASGALVKDYTHVYLRSPDLPYGSLQTRTRDGAFEFLAIAAGSYDLIVTTDAAMDEEGASSALWSRHLTLKPGEEHVEEISLGP